MLSLGVNEPCAFREPGEPLPLPYIPGASAGAGVGSMLAMAAAAAGAAGKGGKDKAGNKTSSSGITKSVISQLLRGMEASEALFAPPKSLEAMRPAGGAAYSLPPAGHVRLYATRFGSYRTFSVTFETAGVHSSDSCHHAQPHQSTTSAARFVAYDGPCH